MQFLLDSPAKVQRLRREPQLRQSLRRLRLSSPYTIQHQQLEEELNRKYFSCGCVQGAVTVQLFLLILGGLWWGEILPEWPIVAYFVGFLAVGLLGKGVGLVWDRWRLTILLARVETLLTTITSR